MKSPFKFLDSYTKDDRKIFFGRDREIEELYQRVFDSKLMLVYGISGTGKSSLIHCGLANKFQDTDWLPIVIRRGGNIIESLASGIKTASLTEQQNKYITPGDFKKAVRSLYLDHYKPVFFIFDQFEELFIFGDKEERKSFIHIVKLLTEPDLQCRMIFVMREEYMAGVTEFEKFIPTFFANRVRIEKMTHINALAAIKGPCIAFNISLEDGFAEALLEKLSPGGTEVELTYLQVFLDKLFRLAQERKEDSEVSFDVPLIDMVGKVSDILGGFLDEQISLMEDPDIAMTILKAFVSGKGTKRPANELETIENIHSFGKEIHQEKVKEMIQSFVKLRVLRDKDDNGRYELRHDSLAEKVYEKFSTAEKELLEIRQFIEISYQSWRKRNVLLTNDDLNYIADKDSKLNLNPELSEFINECRRHQQARKRGVKRLIVFSSLAFIILLSTIGYTLIKRTKHNNSIIDAKESVTQYIRPIDRLSFASSAWQANKGDEAKEALLEAFNACLRNPGDYTDLLNLREKFLVKFKTVSSRIEFAECSMDNNFVYGYSKDSIFIWKIDGALNSSFSSGNSPLIGLRMSDDGKYIAAINNDSILSLWDNLGSLKFMHKAGYNSINKNQIFRFTKENNILTISHGHGADLIDIKGNTIQTFNINPDGINAVDISADGRFIATAGSDSSINIWYLNSETQIFDIYNSIQIPADTIFSIDFAKNSKYVVSTDTRGAVQVTNVNGQPTWSIQKSFVGDHLNKITLGYPVFAEFNTSGKGILVRSAEQKNNEKKYSEFAIYVDIYYHLAQTGQVNKFKNIKYSPDDKYLLVSTNDNNFLLSWALYLKSEFALVNNYRLLNINGEKPFFSVDSRYIYTICGNHLESWYIDIDSISSIALDFYKNKKWGINLK